MLVLVLAPLAPIAPPALQALASALSPEGPVDVQPLRIPDAPRAEARVEVWLDGALEVLDLERTSVRAREFGVLAYRADGRYEPVAPPPERTFTGSVSGRPDLRAFATLDGATMHARLVASDGSGWEIEPLGPDGVHLVRALAASAPACGVAVAPMDEGPEEPPVSAGAGAGDVGSASGPGVGDPSRSSPRRIDCLKRAEIAFDADFEYFQRKGSVAATVAAVEAILAEVDFFYERDVQITHELTRVVVRTAPFYTPVSGGDLLDQFRSEWNTSLAGVPRDLAHLMTSKPGSLIEFGGLAFVGVVCTQSAYGWSMDGANIVGHEVGHNWGAGHCHDPVPCNNMCGACFYIAPITRGIILAHRDSRTCLESVPRLETNHPPYVLPEGVVRSKQRFDSLGPIPFDVLANDLDGDCESIHVAAFDAASALGGTVTIEPDAGPRGRDLLVYSRPADVFVGEDSFEYVVGDPRGATTPSRATVDVRPLTLRAYWPFDETTGNVAADVSGNGNDGIALNPAVWVAGQVGGGLRFAGGQEVATSMPSFPPPWTVSLWVMRLTNNAHTAVLLQAPNGSLKLDQTFQSGKIGVTRTGVADGKFLLGAPLDAWIHLTFVGRQNRTELYANGGLVDSVPIAIDAPTGPFGSSDPNQKLKAVVDDVRFFSYALSPNEVGELLLSGRPDAPIPPDGGVFARPGGGELSWRGAPGAPTHDLYFGTDYAAVRDATPASPEFQGSLAGTSFLPPPIAPATPYFWRVEAPSGAGPHDVWRFALADFRHWPLDDLSGTVAAEVQAGAEGTYLNGPLLGQPGATARLGTAVSFDGVDDFVRLPDLELYSNRATITAWVRRSGPQVPFAGLVFSRAQSTVAGLNFGNADELRYHWNDSGSTWGWNSGLVVPDDTWVFTALVVEPDRARIYLGQGGVLTAATNAVMHAPEEFDGRTNLGRDPTGGRYFRGWMDDVRFYEAALTAGQVERIYLESL